MLFGKDLYAQIPLIEATPPALPSLSPQVWQAAFVHSSKNIDQVARSRFRYAEDFADNERLEWLGDAMLYSIVANYLYRTYPRLRVSYLSSIRQRMVQNATLSRFARLYRMDQALIVGEGSERFRNDQKTLADTFEAFVGAVAQVHGPDVTAKWIEDLIRPYATQLYEHYASLYGEDPSAAETAVSEASTSTAPHPKAKWRRICGFLPLPFFWTPETKSIAGSQQTPSSYGTLVPVSQATDTNGYQRLLDDPQPRTSKTAFNAPASAMKKAKQSDVAQTASTSAANNTAASAVKRSKSRDRVAFTPPSVSNMESLKSAQKRAKQVAPGSLSDGELPRSVPGLLKKADRIDQGTPAKKEAASVVSDQGSSQTRAPEVIAYPTDTSKSVLPKSTATTNVGQTVAPSPLANTATGAPAWNTAPPKASHLQYASTNGVGIANHVTTPSKTILSRPANTPVGQSPATAGISKTFSEAQTQADPKQSPAVRAYIEALSTARADPSAYLENHTYFKGDKSKKARILEYDDSESTPKKCIIHVKVDGSSVAQSAAAAQDVKLAKARAAFKAIEALSLLPQLPAELSATDGFVQKVPTAVPPAAPPASLAIPANAVWLPDLKRAPSHSDKNPAASGGNVNSNANGASASRAAPATARSTPAQLDKQAELLAHPPGPLPGSIYTSLPTHAGKGSGSRYYLTSVKGFTGGTYHAILDGQLRLVGQASSTKKAVAIADAEEMASSRAGQNKPISTCLWQFEDCSARGKIVKKVNLMEKPKADTGVLPLLTHALSVDATAPARLVWLEWYADDKKAWKCVVFADALYMGSGKNAERKLAISAASSRALEELASQA